MDVAERFSQLSTARRLQVGAIVVKEQRIISIGYNGTPSGWDNVCEECCDGASPISAGCYHDQCTGLKTKPEVMHAERNALDKLASSTESGKGATLFVTHSPCLECAKSIYGAGITSVYYKHAYRCTSGLDFLDKCNIAVTQVN